MKHANVFTQMDKIETQSTTSLNQFSSTAKKVKLGWKTACTLLFAIALTLECINVTLNTYCNRSERHYNHTSIITSIYKNGATLLPVTNASEPSIDLCTERREFPLKASPKRINVCTYNAKIRIDFREFINDQATKKGIFFTTHEFIAITDVLPLVRHELLRQLQLLRNT